MLSRLTTLQTPLKARFAGKGAASDGQAEEGGNMNVKGIMIAGALMVLLVSGLFVGQKARELVKGIQHAQAEAVERALTGQ
jgi:hypothetical protein